MEPSDARSKSHLQLSLDEADYISLDHHWSELLEGPAEIKAIYTEDYKAGAGVISRNSYGAGSAWYMGTMPEEEIFSLLLSAVCRDAGVRKPEVIVPDECEVVRRELNGKAILERYVDGRAGGTELYRRSGDTSGWIYGA